MEILNFLHVVSEGRIVFQVRIGSGTVHDVEISRSNGGFSYSDDWSDDLSIEEYTKLEEFIDGCGKFLE